MHFEKRLWILTIENIKCNYPMIRKKNILKLIDLYNFYRC